MLSPNDQTTGSQFFRQSCHIALDFIARYIKFVHHGIAYFRQRHSFTQQFPDAAPHWIKAEIGSALQIEHDHFLAQFSSDDLLRNVRFLRIFQISPSRFNSRN